MKKMDELNDLCINLNKLINNIDPSTDIEFLKDTILSSKRNKKILSSAVQVIELYKQSLDRNEKINIHPVYKNLDDLESRYRKYLMDNNINKDLNITEFTALVNMLLTDDEDIKTTKITNWLVETGYLEEKYKENGKKTKLITSKGEDSGLYYCEKQDEYGNIYYVNYYDQKMQKFIVKNMKKIMKNQYL